MGDGRERTVADWLRGIVIWFVSLWDYRPPAAEIRLVDGEVEAAGDSLHVLLGAAHPEPPMRFALSDRWRPVAVLRIARFVRRRRLGPIDVVVHGVETLDRDDEVIAGWLARLARELGGGRLVVASRSSNRSQNRRLRAHLARLDCRLAPREASAGTERPRIAIPCSAPRARQTRVDNPSAS